MGLITMTPEQAFNIIGSVLNRAVIQIPFGELATVQQAMAIIQQAVKPQVSEACNEQ